jgi:hypothetical protein
MLRTFAYASPAFARRGVGPPNGDKRVSHQVSPHDRFGLPVAAQANECYGDIWIGWLDSGDIAGLDDRVRPLKASRSHGMPAAVAPTLHMHRVGSGRPSRQPGGEFRCESAGPRDRIHLPTGAQADESYATHSAVVPGAGGRLHRPDDVQVGPREVAVGRRAVAHRSSW